MVSILDRIIRGISGIFLNPLGVEEPREQLSEIDETSIGEEFEGEDFRRKFLSGLFYCSGKKIQYFGLTFEQNSVIREDELLRAIEDRVGNSCSELREDFGYSDDIVSSSEVRPNAIWPNVEVDVL